MLEPLANLAKSPEEIFVDTLDISPFMNKMKGFDHARAPDGLYQWIQPTHLSRGNVNISLWHLFTLPNGYKALKASVPTYIAKASGLSCLWKDRKQPGIIFQNSGGFTTLLSSHYNSLLFMSYFTYGYRGIANIYTGFTAVSQSAGPTQSQAQPSMLKRIQPNFAAAIKARRECGVKKMEELPEFEREYFETWSPFAPGYKL
ncbi:hypothetical protein [Actibacterium lipolyticum]|nr:hypothetical protein [Actibacterium lipolyticum]